MSFDVSFELQAISEAVKLLKNSVDSSSDFIEAGNLYFCVMSKSRVKILATNTINFSQKFISCEASSKIVGEEFFINYDLLSQYLTLWSSPLYLSFENDYVIIRCGKDRIRLPRLQGIGGFLQKFPSMAAGSKSSVMSKDLAAFVGLCSNVVAKENPQMTAITGVHVVSKGSVLMVEAADGFHCLRCEGKVRSSLKGKTVSRPVSVILYKSGCMLLSDLNQKGRFWVKDNLFYFYCADGLYALSTLEGAYPDLTSLVPTSGAKVEINVSELKDAVRKSSVMGCRSVVMTPLRNSKVRVEAKSEDTKAEFKSVVSISGKMMPICLDIQQLLFIISLVGGDVLPLLFVGGGSPVTYSENLITYVMMPYHINK